MFSNSVLLFSNDYRTGLPENGIGSVLYNTINAFPNEDVRTPDGNYSYLEEVSDIINPVAQIENSYNYNWANKFVGKEEIVYSINEQFSFTNRFNYNYAIVDSSLCGIVDDNDKDDKSSMIVDSSMSLFDDSL